MFNLAIGVIAAVLAAAIPAQAIPIDSDGGTCASTSTGSVSVSASSIQPGQSTNVTWSFRKGLTCSGMLVRLLYRDATTGVVMETGQRGSVSGSAMLSPQNSGTYFLRASMIGWFGDFGFASVTVSLPVVNGRTTVEITQPDQNALFAQAVGVPNAIVRIAGNLDLDLSHMDHIRVAPGVQIIGMRFQHPRGPRLFTTSFPRSLLDVGTRDEPSDNVRITGLRFDGGEPSDPCANAGVEDADAISVQSSQRVEIDHNEMFRWRGAGVAVYDANGRINQNNAGTVWVHDNYMHDNQHPGYCGPNPAGSGKGGGYGVSVNQGAFALIERNVFDRNRHAITGHGSEGDGYLLYRNLFLRPGVDSVKLGLTNYNHQIDMHGLNTCGSWGEHYNCGLAGEFMDVAWNTVVDPLSDGIRLRGTPSDNRGMSVHRNVFAQRRELALTQTETGLHDDGGNLFSAYVAQSGFLFPPDTGGICDFDGDGASDVFWATGVTWWYFSSLVGHYLYLNQASDGMRGMHTLSDVNGDGRCDVTTAKGTFLTPIQAPVVVTSTAVTRNADGRMTMIAADSGHRVWTRTQVAAGSDRWSSWSQFASALSTIVAQTNGLGLIEVFGADRAGKAWHRWQTAPNSASWSQWEVFGTGLSDARSAMSVTAAANGGLTLFALDPGGRIWGRTQYIGPNGSNGGSWSPWGQMDGTLSTIVAQTNGHGLIELFGVDAAGTVYHRWELTHNTGSWSSWVGFDAWLPQPATITATTIGPGAVVVYGTDSNARIWGRFGYIAPNGRNGGGSWSPWGRLDGALTGITVIAGLDRCTEVFGVDGWGKLFHRKELVAATGTWTPWESLDTPNGG